MGVKRVGKWKRISFVGNLCLRGKVGKGWGRTLMVVGVVSPIVVLDYNRLRVAPGNEWGKIWPMSFHDHR